MTANQILADLDMTIGTARPDEVRNIARAADEGGTIQAERMVSLFSGRPERHTTCRLRQALLWAGCEAAPE